MATAAPESSLAQELPCVPQGWSSFTSRYTAHNESEDFPPLPGSSGTSVSAQIEPSFLQVVRPASPGNSGGDFEDRLARLNRRFVWADVSLIEDVLVCAEFDEETAAALLGSLGLGSESAPQLESVPAMVETPEISLSSSQISNPEVANSEQGSEPAEISIPAGIANPEVSTTELSSDEEIEPADLYFRFRREALRISRLKNRHQRAALNAYRIGDHNRAKIMSKQAKTEHQLADNLNAEAAAEIFKQKNKNRDEWTIDLHGLHVAEAVDAVFQRLSQLESLIWAPNPHKKQGLNDKFRQLTVITGSGSHSHDDASLPRAVINFLIKNRYNFFEPRSGVITVQPKYQAKVGASQNEDGHMLLYS